MHRLLWIIKTIESDLASGHGIMLAYDSIKPIKKPELLNRRRVERLHYYSTDGEELVADINFLPLGFPHDFH